MWDIKSGLNPLLPGTALSTSLSSGGSAALEWIPGRWLKLEQLSKCSLDPEEVPTSLPGQMMRELVLQSFSPALLNNLFPCLNRHRVDQQACCLSRLIPEEKMKGRSFCRKLHTLQLLILTFLIPRGHQEDSIVLPPTGGDRIASQPSEGFTNYFQDFSFFTFPFIFYTLKWHFGAARLLLII